MKRFRIATRMALASLLGCAAAFVFLALAGWLEPNASAHGADRYGVYYVAPGGNCGAGIEPCYDNVQAAVDAVDGPGDVVKVAAGTYTGVSARVVPIELPLPEPVSRTFTQVVYISKTVSIQGGYVTTDWDTSHPIAQPSVLDAQGQGRVLYIAGDVSSTIEGLHITRGSAYNLGGGLYDWRDAGGGVYVGSTASAAVPASGGTTMYGLVTMRNCQIYDNAASEGAGFSARGANIILSSNVISGNRASGSWYPIGGGVSLRGSDAVLEDNIIQGNSAKGGGGVDLEGTITLTGNIIRDNYASEEGGGVYAYDYASSEVTMIGNTIQNNTASVGGGVSLDGIREVTLIDNIISGNEASESGGGVNLASGYRVVLRDNTIFSNTAGNGGGFHLRYSQAVLAHNAIFSNTAQSGGGGNLDSSPATLIHNVIRNNTAQKDGGGVALERSHAALSSNTIRDNAAIRQGGGVYLRYSDASLGYNVIQGNIASGGGGIDMASSQPTLVSNMIVDNEAGGGSAIYVKDSDPRLVHDTLAHDVSGGGIGIYVTGRSTVRITNTIVASYTVGISVTAGNTVAVNGVLWHGTPFTISQSTAATVTVQNQREGLSAFVDPSGGDYHILPSSTAVDAGIESSALAPFDVDGDYRSLSAPPDLGADETPATTPLCYVRLNGGGQVYTSPQAAILASTFASDVVEIAGFCEDSVMWNGHAYAMVLTKTLTVRGGYSLDFGTWDPQTHRTTLNGRLMGGVVAIASGASPTIEYLTLLGGQSAEGGGLWSAGEDAAMRYLDVIDNFAGCGGGAYMENVNSRLEESLIESNWASLGGGVCLGEGTNAVLDHNTIQNNIASRGGGGYSLSRYAVLQANVIQTNTAHAGGGGVYLVRGSTLISNNLRSNVVLGGEITLGGGGGVYLLGTLGASADGATLEDNTICGNEAEQGGGVYVGWSVFGVTLDGNRVVSNTALQEGGGVYFYEARGAVHNSIIQGNTALNGGGVYAQGGAPVLSDNDIGSNTAQRSGGGIYAGSSFAEIDRNTIRANVAGERGGGVYLTGAEYRGFGGNTILSNTAANGGGMYISSSETPANDPANGNVVSGNTAARGAGLYLYSSSTEFVNTVIADNRAAVAGGGMYVEAGAPRLLHSAIVGNDSSGVYVVEYSNMYGDDSYSSAWLTNTILANNAVGISVTIGNSATLNGVLWYSNMANTGGAGRITVTRAITGNPMFAFDGYHILSDSFAVDKGVSVGTGALYDIDGEPRPSNAPDLGVDEYWPPGVPRRVYLPIVSRQ